MSKQHCSNSFWNHSKDGFQVRGEGKGVEGGGGGRVRRRGGEAEAWGAGS
jgi:hypothetical protein